MTQTPILARLAAVVKMRQLLRVYGWRIVCLKLSILYFQPTQAENVNTPRPTRNGNSIRSMKNCLRFSLRSLFLLTVLAAVFSFGFYSGYQRGHQDLLSSADTEAVFDELIELIKSTISTDSWEETGAPGIIEYSSDSSPILWPQDAANNDPFNADPFNTPPSDVDRR